MKNLSTGTGLALLAGAIVAYPFINRISSMDQAAHALPPVAAATAISEAVTAQVAPTIVWYGVQPAQGYPSNTHGALFRAWSDGRVETRVYSYAQGFGCTWSSCAWTIFSDSNQGYNAASDINFDAKVDGADLGQLLADWGDAPRQDIPPSDCPLNLVNP
jgi:hypothetical protein